MNKKIIIIFLIFICVTATISNAQEMLRYNGSSTILNAIMYQASKEFEKTEGVKFDLKGNTTGYGIQKLLSGECDIAGGGRPLDDAEKAKGLTETKLFLDAYAFILHPSNPVKGITSAQISDILNGKLTTWDELGGPKGKKIFIVSPPSDSEHYKNAKKIIGFKELPQTSIQVDMAPHVYKKVKDFPLSFGWISYAAVSDRKDIKILKIIQDGNEIEINQENMVSGKYPYQQGMFLYSMGEPKENVKKFMDFLKSETGRRIIRETGFFIAE